jgi:hypothetical protein
MQEYMAKKKKNQAGVLRRYTQSPRDEENHAVVGAEIRITKTRKFG